MKYCVLIVAMLCISGVQAAPHYYTEGVGSIYIVIDGDTLIMTGMNEDAFEDLSKRAASKYVNKKYRSIRMRIGGINTDELGTRTGEEAKIFLKDRAEKKGASYGCYDVGKYGRLICHVQFGAEKSDIGALMIGSGRSIYVKKFGLIPVAELDRQYRSLD